MSKAHQPPRFPQFIPLLSALLVLFGQGLTPAAPTAWAAGNQAQTRNRPELIVQLGHTGAVTSIAVSPDGRLLATAGGLNAILWDLSNGQTLRQVGDGTAPLSVVFSADGRFLLTAGFDKVAHIWLTATGQELKKFTGHSGIIVSAVFSPRGHFVLTRSTDGTARVWNTSTEAEVQKFADLGEAFSATFSPNGNFVLTTSGDRNVQLWNLANGKETKRFAGGLIGGFSPDGNFILAADNDKTVMYETASGNKVHEFAGTGPVLFSPDGRYVLTPVEGVGEVFNMYTGEMDNSEQATLWDRTSGALVRKFAVREGIRSAAFTPDGRSLLLGSQRRVTFMFETATGRELRRFDGYADFVRGAKFSSSGPFMMTESGDSFVSMGAEIFTDAAYSFWNFAKGQQVRRFVGFTADDLETRKEIIHQCSTDSESIESPAFEFSPDGNYIVIGHCKYAVLKEVGSGRELRRFEGFEGRVSAISFSPDGQIVALGGESDKVAHILNVESGAEAGRLVLPPDVAEKLKQPAIGQVVHFLLNGRAAMTTGRNLEQGYAFLWNARTWKFAGWIRLNAPGSDLTFSSDYRLFLRDYTEKGRATLAETLNPAKVLKTFTRKTEAEKPESDEDEGMDLMDKKLSPDGRLLATGTIHYTVLVTDRERQQQFTVCLFDVETGKKLRCLGDRVTSFTFTADSRFLITSGYDRTVRVWEVAALSEVCRLLSFRDGTWVVVATDGRFDTNNLENIRGLHWVFPDEPFRTLPLEIFLRDYFEPRLLPRLLSGVKFTPIRSLTSLNRSQPLVRVMNVEPEPGSANYVAVTVEVMQSQSSTARGPRKVFGAYDLHLFRDGQLVGRWPDPFAASRGAKVQRSNLDLTAWRRTYDVGLTPLKTRSSHTFHKIQLPRRPGGKVEFTAYAFNNDRVKSTTSRPVSYQLPATMAQPRPRAYLITVGVNANESDWNLDFAVQSAHDVQEVLHAKLAEHYEVVDLQLLSEREPQGPRIAVERATKANIRAVLDLLAGRPVSADRRQELDPQQQFRRATPDDLICLFISSHGYADPQGNFYVIPADTGEPAGLTEAVLNDCLQRTQGCSGASDFLSHSISSDDLAGWWQDIDAGEMLMILDSCHAAAVPGREFKPGPLGDRGFGQLSYDKGMRILTATQPDKTARATLLTGVGHSLLTEALIRSARVQRTRSIVDWLDDAERRVPNVYRELYPEVKEEEIQYPMLLDFGRRKPGLAASLSK